MQSVMDLFRLDGKLALVTGCKRGIGKAMAEALAEAGADIIGVSANLELKDSEIEKSVKGFNKKFYPYQCDFKNRDNLYAFIRKVKNDHPQIDILLNNAGTILRKPVAEHPDEYWDEVIAVNQTAPFLLARELGNEMIRRQKGKIIFTASLLTFQGGIFVPGYTASKSAIGGLVKAFANEWASKGVNVNAIAPGYIVTDNTAPLMADRSRSKVILERIPAGRWGKTDDFKGPAVFLASEASAYMHGTIITVDGGWMGR
ncbi:MAG: SDR family oxidoreductase [Ferruginibacter sp.]